MFLDVGDAENTEPNVRAKAEVKFSLCLNKSHVAYTVMPDNECLHANTAMSKEVVGKQLKIQFYDMSGVACSCLTTACNGPAGKRKYHHYICCQQIDIATAARWSSIIVDRALLARGIFSTMGMERG